MSGRQGMPGIGNLVNNIGTIGGGLARMFGLGAGGGASAAPAGLASLLTAGGGTGGGLGGLAALGQCYIF